MSAGGQDTGREIALGLCQILGQALDDLGSPRTLEAASDLTQVLSLRGLGRLLGVFAAHGGRPWPALLRPAIERVLGLATQCARDGNIDAFRHADDELALTARAIESLAHRSAPAAPAPAASSGGPRSTPVALSEVLVGLKIQRGAEVMTQVKLEPLRAAALRAALDWLLDDGEAARRPLTLASDGAVLEVQCEGISFSGLEQAAKVLGGVDGRLGPSGDRPGVWSLHVAIAAARETFLMFEQDGLALAVPWPGVERVRLMQADAIEAMAQRQGLPVLAPLARDTRRAAEQPVMIVALGLKRACLTADRLVWRMAAEPAPMPGAPPAPGIDRAVRSDDGDVFWVLEPAWLLRDVAAAPLPDAARRAPARPAPARPTPAAEAAPAPAGPRPPIPFPRAPLRELTEEDVAPIEPPAAPVPAPRQALIAEDSITARIFLTRLLEQQGFVVHGVATARELRELLPHGPWTLVFADVDLPDGHGADLLAEARRHLDGAALVALVRDAADEATARAAGVRVTLRKPFERDALERALRAAVPGAAEAP
ncbi:MAG: response regulator [Candidatus Eisenbacteria bacterium]|nr:response regulator [Candidatus Eisenbacteria bacterium]